MTSRLVAPADVLSRLRTIIDPCSLSMRAPTDIVAMGLVEDIEVVAGQATVGLVLTDSSCAFWGGIRQSVIDAVLEVDGVDEVIVELVPAVWTPARMRPPAA